MSRSAVALARLALPPAPPVLDTQLLSAFVSSRAEDPFTELVRRHGPMVLAVCRRVLSDPHDADDAFQATFLVLARKAGSVRGTNVAGWLYGVAVRTARGVRVARDRRQERFHTGPETGHRSPAPDRTPDDALAVTERAAVIDEELAKLPELYREAVVLCELRGLSRREAATELGVPEGTVSSRLAGAKRKLASRLAARGVVPSVALAALALVPPTVSAELLHATALAVRGAAGGTAGAAASAVLKAMLFDQLRAGVFVSALCLAVACGGLAVTGSTDAPASNAGAPVTPTRPAEDPAAKLVARLGSQDFAEREAAEKELRALGTKAEPALSAGLRSDDPEVRARCAAVLTAVRRGALAALVKDFNPKAETQPAHPIWTRFQAVAGNTPAARELFARILKHPEWVARLDAAETGPAAAAQQYREALVAVGRHFRSNLTVFFFIPVWPGDTAEEAAYLLFLGSYPGTERALPKERGDADRFADGEGRIHYARGLSLGLLGKQIAPGSANRYDATEPLTVGSDRVFWKLLTAWLPRRADESVLFNSFQLALTARAADVLPAARVIAADGDRSVGARCGALRAIAQFGDTSDLPLFAKFYDDPTPVVLPPPPSANSPGPRSRRLRVDDNALALALLLCGEDPADYGFAYAKSMFLCESGRPVLANYEAEAFGFSDETTRTAAHAKARAFLNTKKPVEGAKPDPAHTKLVAQLGDADAARRDAAEKELARLGAAAKPALLTGLRSDDPEIARRCAALLAAVRKADWERARAAFAAKPDAFDHPVWQRLKAVAGDGADARVILGDLLADASAFVAVAEAIEHPKSADRLHRAAHARLKQNLNDWYAADAKRNAVTALSQWVPDRGAYPAMLLLGTFPGTGAEPAQAGHAEWYACWVGLAATEPRPKAGGMRRPSAALQRLFVAWLGAREGPDTAGAGFSMLLMLECQEGRALARAVAADAARAPRARGQALLYLGHVGTVADVPAAVAAFGDAREFASSHERTIQVRDIATAVALKLSKEEPADWGFSVTRGAGALKSPTPQQLGFTSGFVRDPILKAAQAKVAELVAPDERTAPAPRVKP